MAIGNYIKEIGRGKDGARHQHRAEASGSIQERHHLGHACHGGLDSHDVANE